MKFCTCILLFNRIKFSTCQMLVGFFKIGKCQKISSFLFCFHLKCWLSGLEFTRIANREDPDQTASPDLGLCCLSRPFGRQQVFEILEYLHINYHHLLILEICQGNVDAPAVAKFSYITKPKLTYLQRATTPEGIVPSSNLKKTL